MLHSLQHSRRLVQLAYTFGRYGAADSLTRLGLPPLLCTLFAGLAKSNLPEREGERLCMALEAMGPTFIKLGQAMSTRSDLVGDAIADDLARLRDRLPPFPASEVRRTIEEDLGAPISDVFSEFDDKSIAAASIAQVHYAVTSEGEKVAVKVLRPGVRQAFAQDIGLFYWIAEHVESRFPELRRLKPKAVVRTFEESILKELDLRMEAAAADTLRENTKNDDGLYIPEVDWNRTSERVLTMERVEGIPISDVEALKAAGHDMKQLLAAASNSFFQQVFRDGFFHADLHPGNLFVGEDGRVIAVDFGITGRIDKRNRLFVAEILRGFLKGDYQHVAQVHIMAGYVPSHHSVDDFALACMAIGKPVLGKPLHEISVGQLLGQLFQVSALFEMETQPQLLLLQKNMMLAEGVGRMLDPNINMWQLTEPLIERWAKEHLSIEGRAKLLADEAAGAIKRIPQLVHKLDAAAACIDDGGFKLHPDSLQLLQSERNRWQQRWWFFAWIALIVTAVIFIR